MQQYGLNELREMFLKFFESKDHLRMDSFSLIPQNDKSLLLINSGMAPLKPYFTGAETAPHNRVTTCQKCIRTPDIENVGKTARHGTFFEMLGNFSFGDYFKNDAIKWAWEFCTEVAGLPEDRLYVSVYQDDDEAYDIWNKKIGLSPEKIFRMGKEDNFWEHGTGPCGPCSEIYYDRGEKYGCGSENCKVGCDCDRYIEFWNNVFTQFNRDDKGNYTPLARKNIDTGMGLERLACIIQDVSNLFEVDTIRKILDYVCEISNTNYSGGSDKNDISIRVITDHIRSTVMMISDGVKPSNEGRGYVLRRLLRRAARHGKLLGIDGTFLHDVAKVVINESCKAYPDLKNNQDYICKMIKTEEDNFKRTIDQGLSILNDFIKDIKSGGSAVLSGENVFKLHDTYGFPLDLTKEIVEENRLSIDEESFRLCMKAQKDRAREAFRNKAGSSWDAGAISSIDKNLKTGFLGYSQLTTTSNLLYILKDNQLCNEASEGDDVTLILDATTFYAESGGQAGDIGIISTKDSEVEIIDCKKTPGGIFLHFGIVSSGTIKTGDTAQIIVDSNNRALVSANHTSTHLLHKALRNTLGNQVAQAGSSVDSQRLRFDFNHFEAISPEHLTAIEAEVNSKIFEGIEVKVEEKPIDEAKKEGVTALFGEKYGDIVRVVSIGDYSKELCGGTHLSNTSLASCIKILGESSVAAGVRRIEAVTSKGAVEYYKSKENILNEVTSLLKVSHEDAGRKIDAMNTELKMLKKELSDLKNKNASGNIDDLMKSSETVNEFKIIKGSFSDIDAETLRNMADTIKNKTGEAVVILASSLNDKVNLIVMASKKAVEAGVHSGNIIREAAKTVAGGGGGRPDMAQAGGKDTSKIEEALLIGVQIAKAQITK
jgi:alanyl-tRNA synthetase